MKTTRLIHSIALFFLRTGKKRANYLKKHHILGGGRKELLFWASSFTALPGTYQVAQQRVYSPQCTHCTARYGQCLSEKSSPGKGLRT